MKVSNRRFKIIRMVKGYSFKTVSSDKIISSNCRSSSIGNNKEFSSEIFFLIDEFYHCFSLILKNFQIIQTFYQTYIIFQYSLQMDQEQKISERTNNYDLEVVMLNGKMDIKLKIFTPEVRKNFEGTLIQDNLPSDIEATLYDLQNIFDCLSNRENYQVNIDTEQLFIKTTHIIGKKQKTILTKIKLEEVLLSEYENLSFFVRQLAKSIQGIEKDIQIKVEVSLEQLWDKKRQEILEGVKEVVVEIKQANQNKNTSMDYEVYKSNQMEKELDLRMKSMEEKTSSITIFQKRLSILEKKNQEKFERLNKRVNELQCEIANQKRSEENPNIARKSNTFKEADIIVSDSNKYSNASQSSSLAMINEQEFSSKSKNNSSFYVHNSELFANNAEENSIHEFRDLFETGTPYAKNFLFDEQNRSITYNCEDFHKEAIQLMCRTEIPQKQPYIFSVKILKARKASIFIGVASKNLQKNARSSYKSGNAMVLYGGGRIWYGSQSESKFFETKQHFGEGDTIVTIVDREHEKITWEVNGQEAGSLINQEPRFQRDIGWVPYFEFKSKGDIIQWLN